MAVEADRNGERLSVLNPFPQPIPGPTLLHDLIAGPFTEGIALEYHDSRGLALELSYEQLHQQASDIARALTKSTTSAAPGIIPLLVPQCAALYISQIAVLQSGAAFCPLNLDVPEERLKFIIDDIGASLIITVPEYEHKFDCLPHLSRVVLDLKGNLQHDGTDLPTDEQSSLRKNAVTCKPSDPAYVMYTSGSTGTPKAVSISHRAVTQSLLAHDRYIPSFSRFLQFANPTFDVSVFEIFFPFFRRSTLVSCDRTHLLNDIPKIITALDIDAAEFTPSVVASLIRSRSNVPKLRTLLTIGEMLNPQTVREFAGSEERNGILFGMYGPTEAAIHCTLQPSFRTSDSVNTIGIPLDTVSSFIIQPSDQASRPEDITILPVGQVGELAVGGVQLADGYLNRKEQTEAAFIMHPTYGRLYRTGDKAKLRSDGVLECLGRISKGQVKLRGQRIELGEIEHAASKLDQVHGTSASVVDGQLVLFCVGDSTCINPSAIEESCRKWLPRYMVPNDIVVLPDFPYLPSGKIDQKKLESKYRTRENDDSREQPTNVQDSTLFRLLKGLISKNLQSSTNLSTSGVDSLKAIKLAAELKRHGYPQLSAVDILMCPTYKDLELLVTKSNARTSDADEHQVDVWKHELQTSVSEKVAHLQAEILNVYPCTSLQDAMLVETAKDSRAYVNSATIALPEGTTFEQFHRALTSVAAQHPALRTGFVPSGHSICAFAQLEWKNLHDQQIRSVFALEQELQADDHQHFLLRPFQVQYDASSSRPKALFHMHHAIYDQWSLDILVDDLYTALTGHALPMRPSFGGVAWEMVQRTLREESTKESLDFWKSYMTGCKATKLPNLTGKVCSGIVQVTACPVTLDHGQIVSIASSLGVSESAIFQTAFGSLLGSYSGETEVTFGTVFSGRTAAVEDVQNIIGPMLTTLPVRISVDGVRRFKDVVRATHSSNRLIMAHLEFPLVQIQKAADMNNSESLFDSVFVWQSSSRSCLEQDSVALIDTTDYVEFNLVLEVEPRATSYMMKATYKSNVLPEAQVNCLFQQINQSLKAIAQAPERQLSTLFRESESEPYMSIFNTKPKVLDCHGGLSRLLQERFTNNPDKPALLFADNLEEDTVGHKTLTYSELDKTANQLAHYLLSKGLQSGGLVLVMMEKSLDLYVSILAVIKAGCGYLPVIPDTPHQRVKRAIDDCSITFALCDFKSLPSVQSMDVSNALCVADLVTSQLSVDSPDVLVDPADVAYAIWTSGTTGSPKGVMVTQENIVSHLLTLGEMYPVQDSSRLLQSCNQSFDVSVFEIFYTWSQGMCLCSAKNDVLYRDIEHAIRRMDITHLSMTPTVASLVDPKKVPKVGFLVTAGEAITTQVFRRWAGKGLWQGYGPSETTNICSVRRAVAPDDSLNNIGSSFSNTSTFVLSASDEFAPVPRGALGELCFGGQQVFRGYQNLPDITSSRVILHPKYGRIYRSGDLGRLAPDDCILIEGRIDHQRKIRGQRIELSEIVATIASSDDVLDTTVLVTGTHGSERLVAFWIPAVMSSDEYRILELDQPITSISGELMQTLKSSLPSYMIPSALIPVTTFPRTRQSKIDTSRMLTDMDRLPPSYFNLADHDDRNDTAQFTETETLIRRTICDTLNVVESHVHRTTSLIRVGLDSVSAIKLATRLRSAVQVQLDVSDILKRPDVKSLAEMVESRRGDSPERIATPIQLRSFIAEPKVKTIQQACKSHNINFNRILPCTPLQEALLSTNRGQGASAYLNRTILRVNIDAGRMKSYWETLVERHQLLRTIFLSTDDSHHPYVQVVIDNASLPWITSNSSSRPDALLHQRKSHTAPPVDSFSLPYVLELYHQEDETYLVIDMHHSLYDANALSILSEELECLHRHESLSEPVLFDGFLEFMSGTRKEDGDKFFEDMLSAFVPQPIPNSAYDSSDGLYSAHKFRIPITYGDVQQYYHKYEVSLLAICQAAWSKVLSGLQDTNDLCFGNVVSGRTVPVEGVDRLVAPCFNTVPVRVDLMVNDNHLGLVKHLHQLNIDTLQYQLHSLRRIQQRHCSAQHLFDSIVLLQQTERPLNPTIWELIDEKGDMDFPCILELEPCSSHLSVSLHYDRGLLKEDMAILVGNTFSETFTHFLRYPLSKISHDMPSELVGIWRSDMTQQTPQSDEQGLETDGSEWSTTESLIREVFVSLCPTKPDTVTRNTTIYRLGLDSISAIQAAKALRSKEISIDAADILEHPSIVGLAEFCDAKMHKPVIQHDIFDLDSFDEMHRRAVITQHGLDQSAIEAVRPCTAVQAGMLTSFAKSEGINYLNHFAYEARSITDALVLRKAWSRVIANHDILRTAFIEVDDSQHSFAMLVFNQEQGNIHILENGQSSDFQTLDHENTAQILNGTISPPWQCHIIQSAGKVSMHLSMHHALYDAESLGQILHHLQNCLNDRRDPQIAPLKNALAYIITNNQPSQSQEDFWTHSLETVKPTRFPNLHPLLSSESGMSDVSRPFSMPQSEVEELCSTRGISLQALFQAAWAKLLALYTGEDEVTFGIVSAGRSTSQTEDACFPCINTLPLSCNSTQDTDSLLQQLMSFNSAVQKHSFTPLSSIQRWLGMPNETLFNTIFAFQKSMYATEAKKEWHLTYEKAAIDYAVSIEIEYLPDNMLGLRTTFDVSVLPQAQAVIMLQQLDAIALNLLDRDRHHDQNCALISILPPKDSTIESKMTVLLDMFDQSVKRYGDRVALEFVTGGVDGDMESRKWTYSEVDAHANQVANLLHMRGVKQGETVALCFEKCPEASFAFVGILKAGCAILAIDATAPLARKAFVLSDSNASAMLCSAGVASGFTSDQGPIILDLHHELHDGLSSSPPSHFHRTGDSISYILYTSGTTGTPKGCELTNENAVQALLAFQRLFNGRWDDRSVWCQFASYHFDVAILEHFWTWSVGIKLLCAPRDLILEDLSGFIDHFQVTHIDLTPSLGRLLDPATVPSLHSGVFITGGEAVKPEMLKAWGKIGCLFNFYGPTECTIGVTTFPSVPSNGKASNIGWQFDNVGTCVLKPGTQELVLRGGIGELCIFGKLVGKGYLNRSDLTEDRFPYMKRIGERIYRTGDLVRILYDDSIDFLGRADSQIKLRGQRLEIDEIVAVMRQSKVVNDAVCIVARHDKKQKEQLVAFISPSTNRRQVQPGVLLTSETIGMVSEARTACEEKLPGYMVPSHFIPVDVIPLNINNKQDDKLLKQLFENMSTSQLQELSTPTGVDRSLDDTEKRVADILSATLGETFEDLHPSTNIFSLGLSSISAVQLTRRLRTAGFGQASITVVMQNATIQNLAKSLRSTCGRSESDSGVLQTIQTIKACQQKYLGSAARSLGCKPESIQQIAPCTPLQQGILYRSLSSKAGLYFNRFVFDLGEENLDKVHEAIERLVQNIDILRTSFIETDDGYIQVVLQNTSLACNSISDTAESEIESVLDEMHDTWIASNDKGLFNPFCVNFVGRMCQINIHHALYDGISWNLLLQRLVELLQGDPPRPENPSFFYVLAHGPLKQTQKSQDFWTNHLKQATFDHIQQMVGKPSLRDPLITRKIPYNGALGDVRKDLHVTSQSIVKAAWIATLAKYHAGPLGLVVSGRSLDIEADEVIGPLFNTIPFAWQISKQDTWSDVAKRCHSYFVESIPFQHTPLRDISKWLRLNSDTPLFDTLFVFQQPQPEENKINEFLRPIEEKNYTADYPLSFEAEESFDGSLSVTIGAQGHYYDESILSRMFDEFNQNLSELIDDPKAKPEIPNTYSSSFRDGSEKHDPQDLNGFSDSFEWTNKAKILRSELAALADVDPQEIDEHTSMFAIGLDSIDAVKLSSRLKKHSIHVSVSALMQSQTIPKILLKIEEIPSKRASDESIHQRRDLQKALDSCISSKLHDASNVAQVLPATPMQESLVSEMVNSDFKAYFNHDMFEINPEIDLDRLKDAWTKVVDASPILRTMFVEIDDPEMETTYAQVIFIRNDTSIQQNVLLTQEDNLTLFEHIRITMLEASTHQPPFAVTFIERQSKKYMMLSIAHALYDGYSLGLLHKDVRDAYHGNLALRPKYDEIVEQAADATGAVAATFWRAMMTDVKPTRLTEHDTTTSELCTHRHELPSGISATVIKEWCRKSGVTVQALCQTAWTLVLAQHTRCLDVVYGLVLAGRDSTKSQQIMFPTMNTVAFRTSLHGTGRGLVKDIQTKLVEMMPYQQTPLRHIQHLARQGSQKFTGSLFNALFTYQKGSTDMHSGSDTLYHSVEGSSDVEYPVAIEAELVGDKLMWRTAIKNSVFDLHETEQLLQDLDRYLMNLINNPGRQVLSFHGSNVSIFDRESFQVTSDISGGPPEAADQQSQDEHDNISQIERNIRDVVAQVAKVPTSNVLMNTKLENLGIDSISAIKVSSILKKRSIVLPVSKLIHAGTVGRMAAIANKGELRTSIAADTLDYAAGFVKRKGLIPNSLSDDINVESVLPATAGQVYLLSAWLNSEGGLFFPTFTYSIKGTKNVRSVQAALTTLVGRHPILRTTFAATNNDETPFIQIVYKQSDAPIHTAAISGSSDNTRQAYADLQVVEEGGGLLLKVSIHHALYDAVSLNMLMGDLAAIMSNRHSTEFSTDFNPFLSVSLSADSRANQEQFWRSYLSDVRNSSQHASYWGRRTDVFDPSVIRLGTATESSLRSEGISLQALFFAAYAQHYADIRDGGSDVVIGIYLANRSHSELVSRLALPTVNTVPLRVKTGPRNLASMAREVQEDLKTISQADLSATSLWDIQRWTGVTIDTFVNFVRLPEEDEDGSEEGAVRVQNLDHEREFKKRAKVHEEEKRDFQAPKDLCGSRVGSAYPPTLDVEATVRNSQLAIGVFGYENRVSLDEANKVISGIRERLEGFFA